jgi:hypothetical protein
MDKEIMEDIIGWFEGDTIRFIHQVMIDDTLEPEYSAVTCSNKIIRLIQVEEEYSEKYKSIESFLDDLGYSEKDIMRFMASREKEMKYYVGKMYTLENGQVSIEENENI